MSWNLFYSLTNVVIGVYYYLGIINKLITANYDMQDIAKLEFIRYIFELERLIFNLYPLVQIILSWFIFMKIKIKTLVLY